MSPLICSAAVCFEAVYLVITNDLASYHVTHDTNMAAAVGLRLAQLPVDPLIVGSISFRQLAQKFYFAWTAVWLRGELIPAA